MCKIFIKYRFSFKFPKCKFFKQRVEYVGYDLIQDGIFPAQTKFDLITNWTTPTHGTVLLAFIGFCSCYHKFCSWFESNIKPLRCLQCEFHCAIPTLLELFHRCKVYLTSSPIFARFESSKSVFFLRLVYWGYWIH